MRGYEFRDDREALLRGHSTNLYPQSVRVRQGPTPSGAAPSQVRGQASYPGATGSPRSPPGAQPYDGATLPRADAGCGPGDGSGSQSHVTAPRRHTLCWIPVVLPHIHHRRPIHQGYTAQGANRCRVSQSPSGCEVFPFRINHVIPRQPYVIRAGQRQTARCRLLPERRPRTRRWLGPYSCPVMDRIPREMP